MIREVREVRGIPMWLLKEYLEETGGEEKDDGRIVGNGWEATLTQMEDFEKGSLKVAQVRIEMEGEPVPMKKLQEDLEVKLTRAGG